MPGVGLPDKALLREMLGFGAHSGLVNAGSMLMFSSGNSLAGMTNGAGAASSFYTTQMPTLAVYNLLNRMNSDTDAGTERAVWAGRSGAHPSDFYPADARAVADDSPPFGGGPAVQPRHRLLVGWSAAICGNAADRGFERLLRGERAAGIAMQSPR